MIKLIKSYFSLKAIQREFTDVVSGLPVYSYLDCYEEVWLKDGRWSLFRVNKAGDKP